MALSPPSERPAAGWAGGGDPQIDQTEQPPPPARSRIPAILFWLVVAAVLFRAVTAILGRTGSEESVGLVHWQSRDGAAAAATRQGRPVLYDFTAAWCGPCRRLDQEGWGDAAIAELVNVSYIPARVVDREREEGANPAPIEELERRYSITAFPTLVIAAPDGHLVAKIEGYGGVSRLRQFLEESRGRASGGGGGNIR